MSCSQCQKQNDILFPNRLNEDTTSCRALIAEDDDVLHSNIGEHDTISCSQNKKSKNNEHNTVYIIQLLDVQYNWPDVITPLPYLFHS